MICYICDRQRCEKCSDECYLTTDVENAVMFRQDEQGNYVERIIMPKGIFTEKRITKIMMRELESEVMPNE